MFDTFDVLVPKLDLPHGFELIQQKTALGPDESVYLCADSLQFARVLRAREAFDHSALESWTGAAEREHWTVLLFNDCGNSCARSSILWPRFLAGLRAILENHPVWRVTCESDCDQHPLERMHLSSAELVALLDRYRDTHFTPIAFYAEIGAT